MLEIIENIEEIELNNIHEYEKVIINNYKTLKKLGGKVVFKKKTTKSGIFLNIYCYDKTNWKYNLRQSIKIE